VATLAINYSYDALGNLLRDTREGITNIDWTVAGKVRGGTKSTGPSLTFDYGASGQRTVKQVSDPQTDEDGYREHYIRDAQGNIMATYRFTNTSADGYSLKLTERPLYGSSRLGSLRKEEELNQFETFDPAAAIPVQQIDLNYELTDHLGNVCAVVTGRLLDGNGGGTPKQAELVSAQGYEPFGSLLPGRNYNASSYRFGFNGMEKDDEVHDGAGLSYTSEYRQYDPRIGRWTSIDPMFKSFPWQSPYAGFDNNPILKNDPHGDAAGDPAKITNAATNAVQTVKDSDKDGNQPAKCNIGVNTAFTEITGSDELKGMRANEMYDHMGSSSNFTPIEPKDAQAAANNGEVVIAAYKAPSGSGHVALVVPGTAMMSGTWEGTQAKAMGGIPQVMDTGAGMRTEAQGVNQSFGKGKQADVVFYKYTPALTNSNSQEVSATAASGAAATVAGNSGQAYFKAGLEPTLPEKLGNWLMDHMGVGTGGHSIGRWLADDYLY